MIHNTTIQTACPRDCQDCCSLIAHLQKGRLTKITGDKEHTETQGFICPRGRAYPELIYHPQRLLHPLRRIGSNFETISWQEAMNSIIAKLDKVLQEYGPQAILHYHYSGSESLTKKITNYFFNDLGATGVEGDLCMSAGISAQTLDFGALQQNTLDEILKAKGCILWGRNVKTTHPHVLPYIKKSLQKGMQLAIINPLSTSLEEEAHLVIRPKPGTDAALALGVCKYLVDIGAIDEDFIQKYTYGFPAFQEHLEAYSLEQTAALTHLKREEIIELAHFFKNSSPIQTLLGFGLQRYAGGGNSIRAIDAIHALTGNIGTDGAGVSYCWDTFWPVSQRIQGKANPNRRFLDMTDLASSMINCNHPPITMAFIHAANPIVNIPQGKVLERAFKELEMLVVVDMFLTDTARLADIILPCTSFLEEEGVRLSSWSPYIFYCPQVLEAPGETRSDEDIILELAQRLPDCNLPWQNRDELLLWATEPLKKWNIDLPRLRREGHIRCPDIPTLAWKNRGFPTPSGRFQFYSPEAVLEEQHPMATFVPPLYQKSSYPYQLISPHSPFRIHSQFQVADSIKKQNPSPIAFMHPDTGKAHNLWRGGSAELYNEYGSLQVQVDFEENMGRDVIQIDSGWNLDSGGCVGPLIPPRRTDMGDCGALYDVAVGIRALY